jgi:hypothetical protein
LRQALQTVFPEYKWPSTENKTSKSYGYWKELSNQKQFFDQFATKWNIRSPEDWYNVKVTTALQEGGWFINSQYKGSLIKGKFCFKMSLINKLCDLFILSTSGTTTIDFLSATQTRADLPNLNLPY